MYVRKRFPHSYKECFVLLSNRCGISQVNTLLFVIISKILEPLSLLEFLFINFVFLHACVFSHFFSMKVGLFLKNGERKRLEGFRCLRPLEANLPLVSIFLNQLIAGYCCSAIMKISWRLVASFRYLVLVSLLTN